MKKRMTWVLVVAAVGLLVGTAFAQFAKTEDAVKYRQSVMSVIGTQFSRMGAVVQGEAPYAKSVVHFELAGSTWVCLAHGVQSRAVGEQAGFALDVDRALYFDAAGARLAA